MRADPDAAAIPPKRTDPRYLHQGKLWQAYEHDGECVLLIDEIDKAPAPLFVHSFDLAAWVLGGFGAQHDALSVELCAKSMALLDLITLALYDNEPRHLRAADRNRNAPENRNQNIGLRCVRGSGRQPAAQACAPGARQSRRGAPRPFPGPPAPVGPGADSPGGPPHHPAAPLANRVPCPRSPRLQPWRPPRLKPWTPGAHEDLAARALRRPRRA
ncbi:hypothetical protein [uncultured Thiodictyon sp.]|uniref:hypothetical protein n=1 Tax=uncultured Thiodictyon sp. TaxID=1846217 RepID=UPI0026002E3D|nr:hypothetical protein [uncultured Thiodictyon sp.]